MPTITIYGRCLHCGGIIGLVISSEREPSNFIQCPYCGKASKNGIAWGIDKPKKDDLKDDIETINCDINETLIEIKNLFKYK